MNFIIFLFFLNLILDAISDDQFYCHYPDLNKNLSPYFGTRTLLEGPRGRFGRVQGWILSIFLVIFKVNLSNDPQVIHITCETRVV